MSYIHKDLAEGRWAKMPFVEQMANIGSEVSRALNWKAKNNNDYCQRAFERALDLVDLTLETATTYSRIRELTRLREAIVDYFFGDNMFKSTDAAWRKYFLRFNFAARINY